MKRKEFLKNSLYAGAAMAAGKGLATQQEQKLTSADLLQTHDFKLKYSQKHRRHTGYASMSAAHPAKFSTTPIIRPLLREI